MNENPVPLDADHWNVCKFDSPADPNYVSVRNSLVKATEDILGDGESNPLYLLSTVVMLITSWPQVFEQKAEEVKTQIRVLESYMHIAHNPADDLVTMEAERSQGSCEWVTKLASFERWRDTKDETRACYRLTGQAGAGKSSLAAYIVRHLQGHVEKDLCQRHLAHPNPDNPVLGYRRP